MKAAGNIIGMICGALFALLLSSCREEEAGGDDIVASTDSTTVQIQFTIDIAGDGAATKAGTWGDEYENTAANDFESKINSLQVLAFPHGDASGSPCVAESVTYLGGTVTSKLLLDNRFFVDGDISKNFNGVVVVAANYDTALSESTSYESFISGVTFSKESGFTYDNLSSTGIPMWGFRDYGKYAGGEGISLHEGNYTAMGEIPLLRSLAKLRVSLDEDDAEYKLSDVKLGGSWCRKGYLAPVFTSSDDYYAYTTVEGIQIESTPHVPSDGYDGSEETPSLVKASDGSYYIYLAETLKDRFSTVTLKYTGNEETKEETFNIDTYSDGKETGEGIDIIRNTVYDYVITVSKPDVEVSLTVLPWEVTESRIGWDVQGDATAGIDPVLYAWNAGYLDEKVEKTEDGTKVYYYDTPAYDTKNATVGDAEAKYCYVSYPRYETDDNAHVSDNRAGADFYFLITAPEGAVWQAHLTNTDEFEFETRALDGNEWGWLYFDTETKKSATEAHYPVSVGIARANKVYAAGETNASSSYEVRCCRPYKITVKPKHAWYTFNSDAVTDDTGYYLYDANTVTLTEWGEKWENATSDDGITYKYKDADGNVVGGPYTDLYITISTSGKESDEQLLSINPAYDLADGISSYYKDEDEKKRYRFAPGEFTGQSIRIWQLKATNKKNADMAADNTANEFFTTTTSDY